MKSPFGALLLLASVLALGNASRASAAATGYGGADGGAPVQDASDDGGSPPGDDASGDDAAGSGSPADQLACDAALCDTTAGGTTCGVADGIGSRGAAWPTSALLFLTAIGLGALRRRGHRTWEQVS